MSRRTVLILRWLARIWSVACLAVVILFVVGEGLDPLGLTLREFGLFLCFPLAVCGGMIAAWWREFVGGIVTVAGFVGFYVVHLIASGGFPRGPWFALLAAPGFLFLALGLLERQTGEHTPSR